MKSRDQWDPFRGLCTTSHLLVPEHRRFAFADRQCLTAMCNQPKQLLTILHIFVAYLTIGDCRFHTWLRFGSRLFVQSRGMPLSGKTVAPLPGHRSLRT